MQRKSEEQLRFVCKGRHAARLCLLRHGNPLLSLFQKELQLLAEHRLVHHGYGPGAVRQDQRVRHGAPQFL